MRVLTALVMLCVAAASQQTSPYAGQERRAIKALSEQEIADLRAGNGMGFAKAAELNGYPGPRHVLELADQIGLTAEQRSHVQAEFERMRARAVELGGQVIEAEGALEELFRGGNAEEAEIEGASRRVAELRGQLRAAHLAAHVATKRLLSDEQTQRYQHLRGYGQHGSHPH